MLADVVAGKIGFDIDAADVGREMVPSAFLLLAAWRACFASKVGIS
jgi:hypothetical protein